MTLTDSYRDFALVNMSNIDSFLHYKGITDRSDRADITQEYFLMILQKGSLEKARDMARGESYMTRILQNTMQQWRRGKYHWGQATNHTDLPWLCNRVCNDSTAIDASLAIQEFQAWAGSERVDKACQEVLSGQEPLRSADYRYFCDKRDLYRELTENAA